MFIGKIREKMKKINKIIFIVIFLISTLITNVNAVDLSELKGTTAIRLEPVLADRLIFICLTINLFVSIFMIVLNTCLRKKNNIKNKVFIFCNLFFLLILLNTDFYTIIEKLLFRSISITKRTFLLFYILPNSLGILYNVIYFLIYNRKSFNNGRGGKNEEKGDCRKLENE